MSILLFHFYIYDLKLGSESLSSSSIPFHNRPFISRSSASHSKPAPSTRSSAIAEELRDALCKLQSCQLLQQLLVV